MEIKFLNISLKENNKNLIKNLNLKIKSSEITGIYHDNNLLKKLLIEDTTYQGNILIDNVPFNKYNKNLLTYIGNLEINTFLTRKVSDEFYLIKKNLESEEDYIKKVVASLKMIGFDETYLERNIYSLSKSESRLLQIAINLIINPGIVIIEEPFLYLDKNNKKIVKNIILNLKKMYKKTVIILSKNINTLYELSNNLIIFQDNKVLISDTVTTIFKDLIFLESNNIELPNGIMFSKIALEHGIKLKNNKDINDLIKDVYRNVGENKK